MDTLRQLHTLTDFVGWVGSITLFVGAMAALRLAWVRLMREYQADLDRTLTKRDKALAEFRVENEELMARVKDLSQRTAYAENQVVKQGAIIYRDRRYIRLLEKQCLARGDKLPEKDRLITDAEDQ